MNSILNRPTQVSDQHEAMGLYLEGLFREQPEVEIETKSIEKEPPITVVMTEEIKESVQEDISDGRPAWSKQVFQTLFIDIGGMDIAIPMEVMSGIRSYPEELTQIPNSVPWIDGVLKLKGINTQVVNTRKLFLSSNNREVDDDAQLKKPEFIVQIGDGRWGLACYCADQAIMLEPDQIRWSGANRRRPWMLGMVKEYLCALLDGDEFIKYLNESAKAV